MGDLTMNGEENDSGVLSERRFKECCEGKMSLNATCMKKAMEIFKATYAFLAESVTTIGAEDVERNWMAGILYVVRKTEPSAGFTLTDILRATGTTIVDFFKEVPHFLSKSDLVLKRICGEEYSRKLQMMEHQAIFIHLMILFNYYRRIYPMYFTHGDKEEITLEQKFGWLLFVTVRGHSLGTYPDLVTCTNALLAVLSSMVIHMPLKKRAFNIEDPSLFPKRDSKGINIPGSLAQLGEAFEDDVKRMIAKVQEVIAKIFPNLSGTPDFSGAEGLTDFNNDCLLYFDRLMSDPEIAEHLALLEKDYEKAYAERGDVDERLCMSGVEGYELLANASNSMMQHQQKIQDSQLTLAGCDSPARASKMPPPTPVSITMTTAKWLRTVIVPLPTEPTPELQEFFKSCDRDITGDVTHRTKVLLESIFPSHPLGSCSWKATLQSIGSTDSSWTEQRRLEAAKLYYRVLTSICRAESQRLNTKNLSSVLMNEKFHRCMLTCSAELVLATHKTVIMTFPAVLEPTGITAFDLTKVIESFVRYEDTLPRELKRHLNAIEERLLESMAWEKGSSMYNALIVARPKLAEEITKLGLLAEPMPSLDTLIPAHSRPEDKGDVTELSTCSPERETLPLLDQGDQARSLAFVSPIKERLSAFSAFNSGRRSTLNLQSVFASPHRPNPQAGGETCAETTIVMFFQKVLKLSGFRAKSFVERIPVLASSSSLVIESVFRLVQYALQNATSLFFKRHIDQIILCSIYGVCKVLKLNVSVTFKEIIQHYRKVPHSKNHVFKNVFLSMRNGAQETGDIIKFYNDIFVPAVKNFLVNINAPPPAPLAGNGNATEDKAVPGSPRPSTFPAIPDMSPKKVSSQHNVYVSPLRSARAENILSPHSRSLYACVGESTRSYQSPSRDLTVINHRLNPRRGRLVFEEASVMSDSEAAGAFAPANERPPTSESALPPPPPPPQSPPAKRPKLDR